jgi:hypothetical protein
MVIMPDPRRLGLATMLATDDASPVLSRFGYCGRRKIRVCAILTQKPVLQPVFFYPKYHKNHDKLIHDIKKPSKKPNSIQNKKSTLAQICCFLRTFKVQKQLI